MASNEGWLCLRFTHLSLNSVDIALDSQLPTAITEQQQIWQYNQLAAQTGIKAGMSINHALMLAPDISLLERALEKEAKKLQSLGFWAYRFSSLVSLYNNHTLLLEIGRSTLLFNGLEHLLHLIKNDLASFNIAVQCGLAHTPKAAYVLSFNQQEQRGMQRQKTVKALHQSTIEQLDIEPKTIEQLQHCGFSTLGDIQAISEVELGQRFGTEFLRYKAQLLGDIADPQLATTPPETFHRSADFAEPISNLAWIQQQLDRLLDDLNKFITHRQLICRSFSWRFFHENNRLLKTVTIGLSAKQNSLATFRELTQLKLASIQLDWEFSSIELSSNQLVPTQLFTDDLFDPKADQQQVQQLVDKLSTRLGNNALFRLSHAPEHLPELANGKQHAVQESVAHYKVPNDASEQTSENKNQPLWLLEQPQRIAQQHRQPHHQGPLQLIHGPDRITSHWWAKLQSRDYFIARQRSGRLLWVFFDRGSKHWFLHGLF